MKAGALLLFLAAAAASDTAIHPLGRQRSAPAQSCLTFPGHAFLFSPNGAGRAMVGLYSGSGDSALLEDFSNALTRLLMARLDPRDPTAVRNDEDETWQLCVDFVSTAPSTASRNETEAALGHIHIRDSSNQLPTAAGTEGGRGPLSRPSPLAVARPGGLIETRAVANKDRKIVVQVDYLLDSAVNTPSCAAPTAGMCNFRSAVAYCGSFLSAQTNVSSCVVSLPILETLNMDPALGDIVVNSSSISGNITIDGNGCTVSSEANPAISARLLRVVSLAILSLTMRNLTVVGFGGASIDGGSIFLRGLTAVHLADVIFMGSTGGNGGGLYIDSCSDVSISGCMFESMSAEMYGGSIFLHQHTNGMAISNCNFTDTSALFGGSLYLYQYNDNMVISDCTFTATSAGVYGGSIYLEKYNDVMAISGCTFVGTHAGSAGGAIHLDWYNDNLAISDCTFNATSAEVHGGSIYLEEYNVGMTISGCTFVDTYAGSVGGAILMDWYNDGMAISDCSFVYTYARYDGGAIYLDSYNDDLAISDCTFNSTSAEMYGGSIYAHDDNVGMTISGCTFTSTYAGFDGGAILMDWYNDGMAISDCSFVYTYARYDGGAIYLDYYNDDLAISDCTFNATSARYDGGAIYAHDDNVGMTISGCTFTSTYAGRDGGSLCIHQTNDGVVISDCNFTDTNAIHGGSIFLDEENGGIGISGCTFTSTSAEIYGGAISIHQYNVDVVISDCNFTATSALIDGGSINIYQYNDNVVISGCIYTATSAGSNGGSIYLYQRNYLTTISGCNFTATSAGYDGGSIYLSLYNEGAAISDCTYVATSAEYGGSIYLYRTNDDVTISDCAFTATVARYDGGAIYAHDDNGGMAISDCTFSNTTAGADGGSINLYVGNNGAVFSGCSFSYTVAGNVGGAMAVYVDNSNLRIIMSSFHSAGAFDGGAIYIGYDNNNAELWEAVFLNNTGLASGGAVFAQSGNTAIKFAHCVFDNNYAYVSGGGIAAIDSNSGLSLNACTLRANAGRLGGGLYVGDHHESVLINDTIFDSNTAEVGAAVYAIQTQLRDELNILYSFLLNNTALISAGAVYSQALTFIMESCAVLGNTASSVGSTFGSMRVETASFVAIRSTKFVQNAAGSAGAVGFRNCDKVFIQDCLFDENLSLDDNGGAVLSESSNLNVSNCVFSRNVAYMNGGAVHVSLAGSVAISCCTFNGNNVSSGSGSAVWMSETAKTDILGNSLFDNCALNGGGTVYWTALLMEEPLNLTTVNNFSDTNLALYGRSVATDIFRLSLADGNIYNVTDYTMPVPLVVVHVIDFYGQIVLTESSSVAIVSVNYADALCYKSAGYVTGGIVELSSSGAYSFASLEAYCDPGYSMPVSLRTNIRGVVFQTSFRLWFRGCETGEYWGERVCAPCEEGTFSVTDPATVSSLSDLTQLDVCLGCPDGSASCHGKTVVLKDGYWRISEKATSTTACPYEGSCGGGSGAGDVLCAAGYEGPLCGVCSDDFSFRSSTQKCEACSGSASLDAVTILFIIVAILIGAVASFVYSKPEFRQQVKTTDDFYVLVFIKLGLLSNMPGKFSNQHYENASVLRMRFMARLKFYILLWQVVALLPFTLDMNFPNVYSAIASVLNVFNLGVDVSSLVSCQSDTSFDAIDNLFFQTMYPIVVSGVLFFARSIHLYLRRGLDADILSQIGSRYFNIFILFMYLILPIVSIAIFQTFSCQDVDPDNIESGADRYMNVDYSVSCSSSKYQFGFTWAIVSIFVYPIGVPLLYFYILYSSKHDISTRLLPLSPPETASRRARLMSKKLLFEFYEPRFWFWEVVETIHRLLLTGVLVVIGQGTGAQIIVGFTVALLFLKLIDIFRPYVDSHVQHVRVMCQWQIYFVFFLALILKADFQSVDRGAVDALLALTITANIIMDVMFVATHLPQRTIKTSEKDYLRDGADDSNSSLGPDSEHTFNPLAEILTAPGESILSERKEDDQSWYKEKAIAMSDFHSCGGGCSSINTGV